MASASAAAAGVTMRRRLPVNAFRSRFLNLIDDRDDPDSALEADLDGPWTVAPCSWCGTEGFGVFRSWEDAQRDEPRAWFTARELALTAAALMPASGKEDWFELSTVATPAGHRLEQRGQLVGFLPQFEERLAVGLHFAECLIRSPAAMASLLSASSPLALKLVGTILARTLDREAGEGS